MIPGPGVHHRGLADRCGHGRGGEGGHRTRTASGSRTGTHTSATAQAARLQLPAERTRAGRPGRSGTTPGAASTSAVDGRRPGRGRGTRLYGALPRRRHHRCRVRCRLSTLHPYRGPTGVPCAVASSAVGETGGGHEGNGCARGTRRRPRGWCAPGLKSTTPPSGVSPVASGHRAGQVVAPSPAAAASRRRPGASARRCGSRRSTTTAAGGRCAARALHQRSGVDAAVGTPHDDGQRTIGERAPRRPPRRTGSRPGRRPRRSGRPARPYPAPLTAARRTRHGRPTRRRDGAVPGSSRTPRPPRRTGSNVVATGDPESTGVGQPGAVHHEPAVGPTRTRPSGP